MTERSDKASGTADAAAPPALDAHRAPTCVACGAALAGPFCAACGERAPQPGDLTARSFLTESFDILDSRAFRTFLTLLRRPGRLSAEYVAGRRRAYLTPFQTFVIANIIFFAAAGLGLPVLTLTTPLDVHVHASPYEPFAQQQVRQALGLEDAAWDDVLASAQYDRLRLVFDNNARHAATTLIIIFAPLFALALALLRSGRHEPAGQHIAFAFHYLAFALLLFVATSLVILLVRATPAASLASGSSALIPLIVLTSLAIYLIGAFRTAYATGWAGAVVQGAIVAFLFFPLLVVYRLLLFVIVLRTI